VKTARGILLLGIMVLGGCRTAKDVAVTSFRVIDAPANYVRRQIDQSHPPATTTTTTTTTVASDAVTPGRTVNAAPPQRRSPTVQTQPGPAGTPRVSQNTTAEKSKTPSPPPRTAASPPEQFPTAKPVPGKPGYVFSPYDPSGGYVDVNGYSPGSKVKDPYSGKIFFVP
jgi:hypothetical protein